MYSKKNKLKIMLVVGVLLSGIPCTRIQAGGDGQGLGGLLVLATASAASYVGLRYLHGVTHTLGQTQQELGNVSAQLTSNTVEVAMLKAIIQETNSKYAKVTILKAELLKEKEEQEEQHQTEKKTLKEKLKEESKAK